MAIAIIEGCCGYPAAQAGPRAELYAGRDPSIRGLFGLSGPRPGDSDYVAPLRPATAEAGTVLAPEVSTMPYLAIGLGVLAVVGLWYWMR